MHRLDQRARYGMRGFGEADETVDRLGEFRGATWTMTHLAGDEA